MPQREHGHERPSQTLEYFKRTTFSVSGKAGCGRLPVVTKAQIDGPSCYNRSGLKDVSLQTVEVQPHDVYR